MAAHPYPLLFATVSGAHLYGFPSPDSDFDLRGAHLLPLAEVLGLQPPEETITLSHLRDGAEVDLVTHEVRKFFRLLLRDNGYVLEQLYSPLVIATTPEHAELKEIARGCIQLMRTGDLNANLLECNADRPRKTACRTSTSW